eukprot:scaffold6326_cov89-Isochrysis_galbana.AAC.2
MVVPPICVAAMPVGAVMATARENRSAKTCRRKETITCHRGTKNTTGGGRVSRQSPLSRMPAGPVSTMPDVSPVRPRTPPRDEFQG